jgi:hypothetical protein
MKRHQARESVQNLSVLSLDRGKTEGNNDPWGARELRYFYWG